MAAKTYEKLLEEAKDPAARTAKSIEWLFEQTNSRGKLLPSSKISPSKALSQGGEQLVEGISIGRMYLFRYDPKLKKELPYYDRYPLIFPFDYADGGFYGINMHYLPYLFRAKLMDSLNDTVNNNKMDYSTKLNISYKILKSASKYKYFRPCVKHYLNNHVKSRFLLIPANMWERVLFLPLERFSKASKQRVFDDSIKSFQRI